MVVPPPTEPDLDLLTHWGDPNQGSRTQLAGIISVLAHIAVIGVLASVPASFLDQPVQKVNMPLVTPLIEPPISELTQKAPNTAKVNKEFSAASEPRPRVHLPPTPQPSPPRAETPRQARIPASPAPKPDAPLNLPEPPKVESAKAANPNFPPIPQAAAAPPPPPQIQPEEKPKLVLETPGGPTTPVPPDQRRVPMPDTSMRGIIRGAPHTGSPGSVSVGDPEALGGYGEAVTLPGAPASQASAAQLLSNPGTTDFKPYLTQILMIVKRNWLSVIPEAVRLGRRGVTSIVLSIDRSGGVPKLVISTSSGADALDRAAVAGISMSNPFPPLPADFKGNTIVVQFNFAYNMPKR